MSLFEVVSNDVVLNVGPFGQMTAQATLTVVTSQGIRAHIIRR
jgi:hypothetical protein